MSEDVKDTLDYLRACSLASISRGSAWDAEKCMKASTLIEGLDAETGRQAGAIMDYHAENAALKATVERLQSQNAAIRGKNAELWAEVERLTPKPMTPDEIVAALNEHKVRGAALWERRNSHEGPSFVFMASDWDEVVAYSLREATYIAQGLLRDAAAQEPEGGR